MFNKLILAGSVLSILIVSGYFVNNLIEENAILSQNVLNLESSNTAYIEAMRIMDEDLSLKQSIASSKELLRKEASIKVINLRKQLNKVLSNEEKECYTAKVPDVIIESIFGNSMLPTPESSK